MEELLKQIAGYRQEIESSDLTDAQRLEAYRIRFLGSKGLVKSLFGEMKSVPADKKKEFGQVLNDFRQFAEAKYDEAKQAVSSKPAASKAEADLSLPGDPVVFGARHPITLVRNRMVHIFQRLGFSIADGPEIEDDWNNFTALNIHENHPARDMQDTFYISQNPDWLLRTHTSNVQIREMQKGNLPIRIICPGRVYRNETVSARSHCFFHQVEGLYIDE
ncbi:MAG TPA: phenylalanine--tRNA ligase subunit alpha, partial [Flavisolibacter sp.]